MEQKTPWEKIQEIYTLALKRKEQDISLERSQPYRQFIGDFNEIRDTHAACAACTSDLDVERLKRKAKMFLSSEELGII